MKGAIPPEATEKNIAGKRKKKRLRGDMAENSKRMDGSLGTIVFVGKDGKASWIEFLIESEYVDDREDGASS